MDYVFTSQIVIDGIRIAPLSGVAVLEADPANRTADGFPDWSVAQFLIDGVRANHTDRVRVAMPDDHWLHDRLLADLLNRYRRDIDELWRAHMRRQQAAPHLALVASR